MNHFRFTHKESDHAHTDETDSPMVSTAVDGPVLVHRRRSLADSIAAPIELVLAVIAALTHWPADWREPLRFGSLEASSDAATHSGSSIGHLSSSSSVKGVTKAIPPISSGDQLEGEDRAGNLVKQDRN